MRNRSQILLLIVILLCVGYAKVSPQADQDLEAPVANYKYYFDAGELRTAIGLVVMSVMMVLCTLAGDGGNMVILPVCMVFFQFDPHVAVAHTACFSALSSLVRVGVEVFKKSDKKFLNYDLTLLSCTPCVMGSVFGVFFNKMCPDILLLILYTIVFMKLMSKSFNDYRKMVLAESKGANAYQLKVNSPLIEVTHYLEGEYLTEAELIELEEKILEEVLHIPGEFHDQFSFVSGDAIFYLVIFFATPSFSLIRGTTERPSIIGMDRCGGFDVFLVIFYLAVLFNLTFYLKRRILERNKYVKQNDANVDFYQGDATNNLILAMVGVGFVGSFLAAGFSLLLNLSLMTLNIIPFVASATALSIGVVFSFSAALAFYMEGLLFLNCAVVGGIVIAVSTLAVRLTYYERFLKSGKASLCLLFMTVMIPIGIVSTIFRVLPKVWSDYAAGVNIWKFASIC